MEPNSVNAEQFEKTKKQAFESLNDVMLKYELPESDTNITGAIIDAYCQGAQNALADCSKAYQASLDELVLKLTMAGVRL
jgi:hypothetical protein